MKKMRIGFAGTSEFAVAQLKALLSMPHDVVVVYTQPDRPAGRGQHMHASPVKELALSHHISIEQPTTLRTDEAQQKLASYNLDVLIVASYGQILPESILNTPKYGCINVHASLLPRWRGASPIQQAILAGDEKTGVTLMRMDKGLDTGNILAAKDCVVSSEDTAGSLHDKLAILGGQLLIDKLDEIVTQPGQVQTENIVTHAGKITKEQGRLNWELPAKELDRRIRAFHPWPIAYSTLSGEMVRIWQAQVISHSGKAASGTIVAHQPNGIIVASGDGYLLITHAQLPGKKCLPMMEILKGHAALFAIGQSFSLHENP